MINRSLIIFISEKGKIIYASKLAQITFGISVISKFDNLSQTEINRVNYDQFNITNMKLYSGMTEFWDNLKKTNNFVTLIKEKLITRIL